MVNPWLVMVRVKFLIIGLAIGLLFCFDIFPNLDTGTIAYDSAGHYEIKLENWPDLRIGSQLPPGWAVGDSILVYKQYMADLDHTMVPMILMLILGPILLGIYADFSRTSRGKSVNRYIFNSIIRRYLGLIVGSSLAVLIYLIVQANVQEGIVFSDAYGLFIVLPHQLISVESNAMWESLLGKSVSVVFGYPDPFDMYVVHTAILMILSVGLGLVYNIYTLKIRKNSTQSDIRDDEKNVERF